MYIISPLSSQVYLFLVLLYFPFRKLRKTLISVNISFHFCLTREEERSLKQNKIPEQNVVTT